MFCLSWLLVMFLRKVMETNNRHGRKSGEGIVTRSTQLGRGTDVSYATKVAVNKQKL